MAYLAQCGPERIPLALLDGAIAVETERDAALLALTEGRGSNQGNTQNEKALYHQSSIDFRWGVSKTWGRWLARLGLIGLADA